MLIAIAGAVTIGAQLDRQARVSPTLATLVPETFRAFAQAKIATEALQDGDAALAVKEAELLVARRPIPAENLRLLAQAQALNDQTSEGVVTIQYAAQRGWRDPLAQETMLRFAMAAGDEAEASRRYAALFLNGSTQDALLGEIGEQLFADPQGNATLAFAEIVGGSDRWPTLFLRRGANVLPPMSFVEIVERASKDKMRFDCRPLRNSAGPLGKRSEDAARQLDLFTAEYC